MFRVNDKDTRTKRDLTYYCGFSIVDFKQENSGWARHMCPLSNKN